MQRLYVVACAVDLTEPSAETTAFNRLVEHLALHLDGARTGLGSADLLDGPGTAIVKTRKPEWADNHLSWQPVLVDDRTRALRLTIEHDLETGGRFVCELTAAEHAGETGFRVVLGRRSDGRVTPARVDDLKPPRALRAVMADDLLRCADGTDRITATVTHALTAGVADIRARLADPQRRLPILAVSAMRPTGAPAVFARAAADQLAGLAHVVVISGWLALSAFNADRGEQHRLYRDSARLFWPDLGAWNPWWDAAALHGSHDEVLARITRTITPFSVVARGRDRLWDAVRTADNDSALDGIAESEAARITALEAKLADEQQLNLELLEANEQLEQQIRLLQNEVDNKAAQRAYAPPAPPEPEAEAVAPVRDFTGQWAVWEARSEGALVFTDRAKSSWADCAYDDYACGRPSMHSPTWPRRGGRLAATSASAWRTGFANGPRSNTPTATKACGAPGCTRSRSRDGRWTARPTSSSVTTRRRTRSDASTSHSTTPTTGGSSTMSD
ncbi:hypothetical protein AB0A73_21935 [Glycomyces sp. NPDC047369]